MRYVMILAGDEAPWNDPGTAERLMGEITSWWEKWSAAGKIEEGGAELQPSSTAKTVGRGADGRPTVTDGPFLELKEVVGAIIFLTADDMDEAVAIASTWPGIAAIGDRVEIRPVLER
ncbi:YciI family protein [Paractinoplanes hotanensis]|uniref:YciI family protein n=1 Tax=Paractinoplanes hotanensis TaxID=2906497 RepID=A0ABT0Y985_9ACTN|nr:YciI family protein [Actinoplanes hotanensis]MCM4082600.1 YciI family protein [Actinoplanes hotanensis]